MARPREGSMHYSHPPTSFGLEYPSTVVPYPSSGGQPSRTQWYSFRGRTTKIGPRTAEISQKVCSNDTYPRRSSLFRICKGSFDIEESRNSGCGINATGSENSIKRGPLEGGLPSPSSPPSRSSLILRSPGHREQGRRGKGRCGCSSQ